MDYTETVEQLIHCPILAYHHFKDASGSDTDMSVSTTPQKLEKDLTTLLEKGYTPISLAQRYACAAGRAPWPSRPFICTMDDGYESNYLLAFPVLKRLGVHTDIFILTDYMGKQLGDLSHLSWEQASEMEQSGLATMQAHGKQHLNNAELSMEEFHDNVFGCIEAIEQNLGKREYMAYAHPCAHYQEEKFQYLHDRGIQNQTMNFWLIKPFYLNCDIVARLVVGYEEDVLENIEICKTGLRQRLLP